MSRFKSAHSLHFDIHSNKKVPKIQKIQILSESASIFEMKLIESIKPIFCHAHHASL